MSILRLKKINVSKRTSTRCRNDLCYFAVNTDGQLVGVLSLRDLIVAENDAYIEDIMSERVISVNVADDQEDVAQKMRDYDFIAMPVIDYQQHCYG